MDKKMTKLLALCDSPQSFFKSIPTDLQANIEYRIRLHGYLATDTKAQDMFLSMCRAYLPIAFNTSCFTLNPQKPPRERNQPFILRPVQVPAVEKLCWCIDNEHDVGINKSRKQGASELCVKVFTLKALLEELSHFILGSRKEDLVDKSGDLYTLFAKADSVMQYLPSWWKKQCGYRVKDGTNTDPDNRTHLLMRIPYNNSRLSGEATNESFSAGSRGTGALLDEFGRNDYSIAESIEGSIHDVTGCVVYSSTHWLGQNHPFNLALKKPSTTVINLMWYSNPEENMGLYETPEPGKIQICDLAYYQERCPDVFTTVSPEQVLHYDDIKDQLSKGMKFVADGLKGIPSPFRAPWFDQQEEKRKGNKRDFICNVCGTALGSAESPFDHAILADIKKKHIRRPDLKGELIFDLDDSDRVIEDSMVFCPGRGAKRLRWWGELLFGRPDQRHNYVVAADPSYGLGSANSAAIIIDVNTHEQIGSWADANTKPEEFADQLVALAYWIGGITECYVIWESTGGCGSMLGQRIVYQGYTNVYTQRREDSKTRKKTNKYGWNATGKTKDALLGELGIALSGGLSDVSEYKALIIRDHALHEELCDYIFKEKGSGAVCSSKADLSTGALERHGDRVIAAGLCVLAYKEQQPGNAEDTVDTPHGSFAYYQEQRKQQEWKDKRELRRVLF